MSASTWLLARWASTPARAALRTADAARRAQGRAADLAGLGPQQLPSRVLLTRRALRLRSYRAPASSPPVLALAAHHRLDEASRRERQLTTSS